MQSSEENEDKTNIDDNHNDDSNEDNDGTLFCASFIQYIN